MTRFKKIRKAVSLCLLFVFFLLMISGCDVNNKRESNGAISVTDSKEENATDEKLIDLVHKMNWYGLYAQKQFNYNPVDFEEPAVITNFNDAVLSDYAVQNTGTAEGIKYTSGSLQLDSDTGIKVNYTLTGTDTIIVSFHTDRTGPASLWNIWREYSGVLV